MTSLKNDPPPPLVSYAKNCLLSSIRPRFQPHPISRQTYGGHPHRHVCWSASKSGRPRSVVCKS